MRHAVRARAMRTSATAWREAVAALAALMAVAFGPAPFTCGCDPVMNDGRRSTPPPVGDRRLRLRLRLFSGLPCPRMMFARLLIALVGLRAAARADDCRARLPDRNEAGFRTKIRVALAVVITCLIRDIDVGSRCCCGWFWRNCSCAAAIRRK